MFSTNFGNNCTISNQDYQYLKVTLACTHRLVYKEYDMNLSCTDTQKSSNTQGVVPYVFKKKKEMKGK